MLAFDVGIQGGLLDGLEAALIARKHLVFHFVPTLVRVQGALLRAREVAEVAVHLDALLDIALLRRIDRHIRQHLAAILSANFFFDHQLGILLRGCQRGYLLGYLATVRASNRRTDLLRRCVIALCRSASRTLARVRVRVFLGFLMIAGQVGRQSGAPFALKVAQVAGEACRVFAPVLQHMSVEILLVRTLMTADRAAKLLLLLRDCLLHLMLICMFLLHMRGQNRRSVTAEIAKRAHVLHSS